jgi:hypothetical protein
MLSWREPLMKNLRALQGRLKSDAIQAGRPKIDVGFKRGSAVVNGSAVPALESTRRDRCATAKNGASWSETIRREATTVEMPKSG